MRYAVTDLLVVLAWLAGITTFTCLMLALVYVGTPLSFHLGIAGSIGVVATLVLAVWADERKAREFEEDWEW